MKRGYWRKIRIKVNSNGEKEGALFYDKKIAKLMWVWFVKVDKSIA